ncbi:MAG: DUF973 family protein [Thermoplasmata archaeon]
MWKEDRDISMAARFCAFCGQPVLPNARFCPSCGAAVGGATPPPSSPPGTPPPLNFAPGTPYSPYQPTYPATRVAAPAFGGADRLALLNVRLAAILGLVGVVLSFVVLSITPIVSTFTGATTTSSGSAFSIDLTSLYVLIALGGVGIILALLEFWYYRQAFRTLAQTDRRFSTPASLTLLAFVALVIILVLVGALIGLIYQAFVCAGSGGVITSTCVDATQILGLVVLIGITAIVLFVGYIGLLIGIWRLGTRYGDSKFQVGAVLLIFPLLNIVGLILILVAAQSARGKLGLESSPLQFG